jgi:uncharacterized protein (TIGR00255 family)
LDIHVRLSREYLYLEGEIQQLVRSALSRGRVDVNVSIQNTSPPAFFVNTNLARAYLEAADKLRNEFKLQDALDLKTILSLPGIVEHQDAAQADTVSALSELASQCVRAALDGVLQMRQLEGQALRADMLRNLADVEHNAGWIKGLSATSAAEDLQKLRDRLAQLLPQGGIDPQRLAQEAALLADKCDISEEVSRLMSHIVQYRALVDAEEKAGKKLDFLLQELQREANTILSKSGSLDVSRRAISIKTDIEKLREQVQNVE